MNLRERYLASILCSVSILFPLSARAFSPNFNLGFENDLSRKTVTPSEFPIVSGGVSFESEDSEVETESEAESNFEYKGDIALQISPTHRKAFALASRNLYFGEKDDSYDSPLRFSYGRRLIGWSKIDELWGLGEFEPLYSWDRLRPFTQGLTGIFGYTETQQLQFRFFLSYLFIPETTPNVVIENQEFVNEHPQSVTSGPQSFDLLNRPTPLGYELNLPSISKIIFRPSVLFMFETKREIPFYGKFAYGYLPLNYFPIALEASLGIPLDQIVVQLRPRLLHHHLYNAETAYRFSDSFSAGVIGLVDQPIPDSIPDTDTTTPLSTSFNLSPWIQYQLADFKLTLSQIWVTGGLDADVGQNAKTDGTSLFSSHLFYRNATQLALKTEIVHGSSHHPTLQAKYVHEYSILADWIAADFYYTIEPKLVVFVGGDLIGAERGVSLNRGAEFLADLRALDRIRAGVTYVF